MATLNNLICPVSTERVDENRVRVTAFQVVMLMGAFLFTGNLLFSAVLAVDFFIRAFTRLQFSPLSFVGNLFVRIMGMQPVWIDKAPKVFAARVGFLLAAVTALAGVMEMQLFAVVTGTTLVVFAFLECGLNFCAGCWVYTYIVYPMVRKGR
jgi:hypothetical protein